MENLKFRTRAGIEIELDSIDMSYIHQHYEEQCTADYLREIHEDWDEEKVQVIAADARRYMFKYDYEEDCAIDEAIRLYEETYKATEEVIESEDE